MFATAFATAWARRTLSLGTLIAISLGTALAASTGLLLSVPALVEFIPLFATGSSIALFISVFVVAGAITFGVDQRARELALLRAIGASPRQVSRLVVGETMIIACVGVTLGLLLSHGIVDATVAFMRRVDWLASGSADPNARYSWIALATAAAIGLTVALVAAVPGARRASRARPIDALRSADIPVKVMTVSRAILGIIALSGGFVLLGVVGSAPPSPAIALSILTPQLLTVGLVALGPVLISPLIRIAGLPVRALTRATGTVAMGQLRTGTRRSTSTAGTVITLVGVFGALVAVPQTLLASESASNSAQIVAQIAVSQATGAPATLVTPGGTELVMLPTTAAVVPELDPDIEPADAAEAINEVVAVMRTDIGDLQRVVDLSATSGVLASVEDGRALISSELALELGVRAGATIPLRFGDGTETSVTVGAVAHLPTLIGAQIVIDEAISGPIAAQDWVDDSGLAVVPPGQSVEQGLREIATALPEAAVAPTADVIAARTAEAARVNRISLALVAGVATLFSVIAIANTQAMGARERRRDVTLLRRTGATPGQVARVVTWEVLLTVAVGAAIGAALALAAGASTYVLAGNYMVSPTLGVPWALFAGLAGVAVVVATLFATLPLARSFWAAR